MWKREPAAAGWRSVSTPGVKAGPSASSGWPCSIRAYCHHCSRSAWVVSSAMPRFSGRGSARITASASVVSRHRAPDSSQMRSTIESPAVAMPSRYWSRSGARTSRSRVGSRLVATGVCSARRAAARRASASPAPSPPPVSQASRKPRWPWRTSSAGKVQRSRSAAVATTTWSWPGRWPSRNSQPQARPKARRSSRSGRSMRVPAYAKARWWSMSRWVAFGSQTWRTRSMSAASIGASSA